MKNTDCNILPPNVLPSSCMFFYMPMNLSKQALYYITYIGRFDCDECYAVSRKQHNDYLLMIIDSGQMKVVTHNTEYIANAGDVVLLDCTLPHEYGTYGNSLSFHYFHFNGSSSAHYLNLLASESCILHPSKHEEIETAFNSLFQLASKNSINEDKIKASVLIFTILCELSDELLTIQPILNSPIYETICYLRLHYAENLSLASLAQLSNMSVYYFCHVFQKYTKISPYAYITDLRISYAQSLLTSTQESIESISAKCGFSSAQLFIRAFKKRIGFLPSKYRKFTKSVLQYSDANA
jgi:AraC-type DNA-binding domain-containing proteins